MSFSLLAYTEIDGIRTVPDSDIKRLWRRTVSDGLGTVVFYENTIKSESDLLAMAKHDGTAFYLLMDGVDTVGYTWLNRFENYSARQHFCVFKEYWGKTLDIGRFALDFFMNLKDENGKKLLGVLTGVVPAWNDRAIRFALKCGGKTYGKIPNYIGPGEDAVLIYYTTEDK